MLILFGLQVGSGFSRSMNPMNVRRWKGYGVRIFFTLIPKEWTKGDVGGHIVTYVAET